jgi:TRAP-type C4-dicarboxylate transport system substrate-binding protein
MKKLYSTLAVSLLAATALAGVANARTYKLTIAAGQPTRAIPALAEFSKFWVPEVQKRIKAAGLKDTVEFKEAYAGTLLKPRRVLLGVQDGIADIGFVPALFHPDKLPLEQISFVTPFCTGDLAKTTNAYRELYKKLPAMAKQYDKFNVERIAGQSIDSYQFFTAFPFKKVEDLKGRKMAATGALLDMYKGLGVTTVDSNMMEYYNSTKTGVYEGFIIFGSSTIPMKYPEAAPYVTKTDFGAVYTDVIVMNKDSMKRLPKEIQKIMRDVAKEWEDIGDKAAAAKAKWSFEGAQKAFKDAKFYVLPDEERKKWAEAMPNVATQWADRMEKKGLPGKQALKIYMDSMRAQGAKCMREWDKG